LKKSDINKQSKRILQDHTKRKKKLIPPLLNVVDPSVYSYTTDGIPQIIWIHLITKKYPLRVGVKLIEEFVSICYENGSKETPPYHISWFELNEEEENIKIRKSLIVKGIYTPIKDALQDLLGLYPKCPLNLIFSDVKEEGNIINIKEALVELYIKTDYLANLALTNTLYICSSLNVLKVATTDIPNIEEAINYPNTEESIRLGSFVRSTSNLFLSNRIIKNSNNWVNYFWNRNLELEKCTIKLTK
jgi:hypothetical protein